MIRYCRLSAVADYPLGRVGSCLIACPHWRQKLLCIVALGVGVGGWKLCRRVPSRAFPIHFFRRFCCRVCRLVTVLLWNVSFSQTRHFRRFGSAAYRTLHAVRSALLATAMLLVIFQNKNCLYFIGLQLTVDSGNHNLCGIAKSSGLRIYFVILK